MITKFKIFEKYINKMILYHGSPKLFKNFSDKMTFFSDTFKFAEDYGNTKAMDFGLDDDICVYTCEVSANLFDINDKSNYDKLEQLVPDKIEIYLTNFPITSEINKENLMLALKGLYIEKPYSEIVDANIGDLVPDPINDDKKYLIINKDDNYIYTINNSEFIRMLQCASSFGNSSYSVKREYRELFNDYRNKIKEIIKSKKTDYLDFESLGSYFFDKSYQNKVNITESEIKEVNDLYQTAKQKLLELYTKDYTKKWNTKPETIELSDTWRYFENDTIIDIIKDLNFDGYIAKERKTNTYAIFDATKVNIISYYIHGYKFDKYADINNFHKFENKLYSHYKSMKYGRDNVYKYYKSDLDFNEIIKLIDKNI